MIFKFLKIKPLGNIPRGIYDEIYQAALEAGQGGIRWNSTTSKIQLMDENKNWINWKSYHPNAQFQFMSASTSGSFNFTFPYYGCYAYIGCADGINYNITSPNTIYITNNTNYGSSRKANCGIINASDGQTMTVTFGGSNSSFSLFYLCNQFAAAANRTDYLYVQDAAGSLSFSNASNRILIATAFGGGLSNGTVTSTVADYYTNSRNYACISTIRESGGGTILLRGASGSGGTYIEDIQLVF